MSDRIEQLIALGREHYSAGEYDRALPALAEAAAARPSFPDIYNMLGVIYHAQGRFSDAEEAFEIALRLNPRYTEAALNLSVTYNDRGKYDKAREVYSRAVSGAAGRPDALDRFARGTRGKDGAVASARAVPALRAPAACGRRRRLTWDTIRA